jgi:hypothetical protein
MYRVLYTNYDVDRARDFEYFEDALSYAEARHLLGWLYIRISDEYDNTIVEFVN